MATAAEYSWLSSCANNVVIKDPDNRLSEGMINWRQIEKSSVLDRNSGFSATTYTDGNEVVIAFSDLLDEGMLGT